MDYLFGYLNMMNDVLLIERNTEKDHMDNYGKYKEWCYLNSKYITSTTVSVNGEQKFALLYQNNDQMTNNGVS